MEFKEENPNLGDENDLRTNTAKEQNMKKVKTFLADWLNELSQKSSLQGFQYMTMQKLTIIEKIFWLVTFMVSIVLSYLFILEVWIKWRTSPVIVSFSETMVPVGVVPFPSVTICPQRKALRNVYNFSEEYQYYLDVLEAIVLTGSANASVIREIEKLENIAHICHQGTSNTVLNRTLGDTTMIDDIFEVSPQIRDVFYQCAWRGQEVPCDQLFTNVLTYEGLCFNFNSLAVMEIFNNESFPREGIKYNYLGFTNPSKGWTFEGGYDDKEEDPYPRRGREAGAYPDLEVILMDDLNDRDGLCNSMDHGYTYSIQQIGRDHFLYYYPVLTEETTSMALTFSMLSSSSSLTSYSPEIRQCYFPSERKLMHYRIYTASNCVFECQTNYTFAQCGCVWYNMPFNDSIHYCTIEKTDCYNKAKEDLATKQMRLEVDACNCLPACNSIDYDAGTIQVDFDLRTFMKSIKKLYRDETLQHKKKLRYSRMEMFFKYPRFVSMHRSELFGLTDFLANCGGLLGLFLGFSFLSVVEILYFMTLRLCCMIRQDRVADASERNKRMCNCKNSK